MVNILALNCGSSSLRYQLFCWERATMLASGLVERIGLDAQPHERAESGDESRCQDHGEAIARVLATLVAGEQPVAIDAVGHRVVHGGDCFDRSVRIDPRVIETIEALSPLAPLHNLANLAGIRAARHQLPGIPQVAVFDTAFHQSLPPRAYTYAVPADWSAELGVRRYGFHGTSHLYVSRRAALMLNQPVSDLRLITCHVGNGVSLCAIKYGVSIDTSMGFTPTAGAVMGTRAGDIDPSLLPYVHARTHVPYEALFRALDTQSGMRALAGYSDLREVEAGYRQGDARCARALEVYAYRLKTYIGAYAAALGGVDAIVFTAGVGENSPLIRDMVLSDMAYLGVTLDPSANHATRHGVEGRISTEDSRVPVLVVATDEERIIIEDTVALLEGRSLSDPQFRYAFEGGRAAAAE